MMKRWQIIGAVVVVVVVALGAVLVRDVQRIDPTSGGYDPPYTDVTGEPIEWRSQLVTDTGFRDDGGWVLNMSLDCTSGMLRGHVGPFTFDYRTLSERAIVVHEPHVACREAGFEPAWDHTGTVPGHVGRSDG